MNLVNFSHEGIMIKYVTILFAIIFSSCAVISTSQFETAQTIGEGNWQIGLGGGLGRDVSSGIFLSSNVHNFTLPISEGYVLVGVTPNIDVGVKTWLAGFNFGEKVSGKFQLSPDDAKFFFAFAPALSLIRANASTNTDQLSGDFSAWSVHLPILWSTNTSKIFSLYGGFQYVYTHLSLKDWDGVYKSSDHHSPGFTVGFQFKAGPVVFMPECSFLLIRDFVSDLNFFVPFPNFGVGSIF